VLVFGAAACGGKENASLTLSIVDPRVEVTSLALGAELSGGFDLRLELGEYAPERTEVSLGAFALRRGQTEIVAPLPLSPGSGVTFPVAIGVGEVRLVHLDFDASSLLGAGERDAVCEGPLVVAGAITDTLSGGKTTSAAGPSVTPECPVQ